MDQEELEHDRKIDPNALDVEAATQADRFFKWAERAIEAEHDLEEWEFKLKVAAAELELTCREDPESFGLKSATEAAIKAVVIKHPEYVGIYQKVMLKRRKTMKLKKAEQSMEIKKRMIEALITLHGQEYFAGPSVPRNLGEAYMKHQKKEDQEANRRQANSARRVTRDED